MKTLGVLALLLAGLTLAALRLHTPGDGALPEPGLKDVFVALLGLAALVYFAAVALVLRRRQSRAAIWLVLAVAVAVRVPVLLADPFLSTDIYRYVWDGRVQAAGINPYVHVPADPALSPLRDDVVYPHINRADYARTIYPPMAQMVFAAVGRLAPTFLGTKVAMVGFEALAIACLLGLLAMARLPPERVLIYAWNPLVIWSFAGNGHVDAVGAALLAAALLLRCARRFSAAGVVFGAAVLVKFLPVAVAPALWRRGGGWRLALGAGLAVLALYALYARAGWHVLGFLPGYGREEGLDDGSGIWLLAGIERLTPLPAFAAMLYFAAVAAGLAALGAWFAFGRSAARTGDDPGAICGAASVLAACVTAAISPHYPWYFAWLAVPAAITPYRAVLWLGAAPVLLYINPFDNQFTWPSVVYGPAVLLAIADLRRSRALPAPVLADAAIEGSP
jgi:alpha-1,6-mannosyltransferase